MAHGEILILNYKGEAFLEACISSIAGSEASPHTFGITVIDNGSPDFNLESLGQTFPDISIVSLESNLGFSRGYNIGVQKFLNSLIKIGNPEPDFLVLLNNDTCVDSLWFKSAADTLLSEPGCGICGSRTQFLDEFIIIDITSPEYRPANYGSLDTRTLGVFLSAPPSGKGIGKDINRYKYQDCFGPQDNGRWLGPKARLFVPVDGEIMGIQIKLLFENHHAETASLPIVISSPCNAFNTISTNIERGEISEVIIKAPFSAAQRVLQNAGSLLYSDFSAGDRGFLEIDTGQYNTLEEVDSVCGVSMFIRTELWKYLGGFNEDYYAYYEDTDLCLRARLAGYRCLYQPESRLQHVHSGTSIEGSQHFKQLVQNSKLVFGCNFMPPKLWKMHLGEMKKRAKIELGQWIKTHTLLKPFALLTLKLFYGRYFHFVITRIRARFEAPWKSLTKRTEVT